MVKHASRVTPPPDVEHALNRLLGLIWPVPDELLTIFRNGDADVAVEKSRSQIQQIADWLYRNWYTLQPFPESSDGQAMGTNFDLCGALRASSAASRRWQRGWVVLQAAAVGGCIAGNKRATRVLAPGQYANLARPGMPPAPGDAIAVNELVDWVDEGSGFWFMQSPIGGPADPLVRLYFNVNWQQLGAVLYEVTARLDEKVVKYSLKCPINVRDLSRVDTMIVYLSRSDWKMLEPLAIDLALRLQGRLRMATPPLTRSLGPGVGFAEDPGGGISFGESRCRALAPGVLGVLRDSIFERRKAVSDLTEALLAASINLHKPWQVTLS